MEVTYLDHMGSDLTVVNAARVSFAKRSEFDEQQVLGGWCCQKTDTVRAYCETQANGRVDQFQEASDQPQEPPGCTCVYQQPMTLKTLKEKDARLIKFLARSKHEIPFAHPHISFHAKAPLFVARQVEKHQVGVYMSDIWSEISRRYVSGDVEFYWPERWRKGSPDIKQGSLDESIGQAEAEAMEQWKRGTELHARNAFATALNNGVCMEQARMFLPNNLYTEWHWTGSLLAWARIWNLRVKPGAQEETREFVKLIGPTMETLFPVSWKALVDG